MAAKVFAADLQSSVPPEGQSIHYVIDKGSALDVAAHSFLCGVNPKEGARVVIAAPLDDSRWCPKCMGCRPSARGSSVRIVTVLHSR